MDAGRKIGLQYPHDFHRTAKCGSILFGDDVGLYHGIEHQRAFFKGVSTCGNVWVCPVCAAKIQERRRIEVSEAMEWAYSHGKKCVMVTFTFPHTSFQSADELLGKQAASFKHLRTGKAWQKEKEKIGFVGLIRALEITIGSNGWHPHTHELWIVNEDCDVNALTDKVLSRWQAACIKTGLLPVEKISDFRLHSVNMKDNAQNSDYFAKFNNRSAWGIDREIAKASTKGSFGCHPFELLCDHVGNLPFSKEKRFEMFLEYASATKAKKQLYWSQGLKAIVGIDEKSDIDLAEEEREIALLLGRITPSRWKLVVQEGSESEILYLAETGGWNKVDEYFKLKGT
jgi:hypothetical protein